MVGRLLTHYYYGLSLRQQAAEAVDPATKTELEDQAVAQYGEGVERGERRRRCLL